MRRNLASFEDKRGYSRVCTRTSDRSDSLWPQKARKDPGMKVVAADIEEEQKAA